MRSFLFYCLASLFLYGCSHSNGPEVPEDRILAQTDPEITDLSRPLWLDLKVRDIEFEPAKVEIGPIGPFGKKNKVILDHVYLSREGIDILSLSNEKGDFWDAKLFLDRDIRRERDIIFGRTRLVEENKLNRFGLNFISKDNERFRFRLLLGTTNPLNDMKSVTGKDMLLRINPTCPQFLIPHLELKLKDVHVDLDNIQVLCPFEGYFANDHLDNAFLKCLNRGGVRPLNKGYPSFEENNQTKIGWSLGKNRLCNQYLKSSDITQSAIGGPQKGFGNIKIKVFAKPEEEEPSDVTVEAKTQEFNFSQDPYDPQMVRIQGRINQLKINIVDLVTINPREEKGTMNVFIPFFKVNCRKSMNRTLELDPENILDECLDNLKADYTTVFVEDEKEQTAFRIELNKAYIDPKKNIELKAPTICITGTDGTVVLNDTNLACAKNPASPFIELPDTIEGCIEKASINVTDVKQYELNKEVCQEKAFLKDPTASIPPIKKDLKASSFLKNLSIKIDQGKLDVQVEAKVLKIFSPEVSLQGDISWDKSRKVITIKPSLNWKKKMVFGIMKKFIASSDVRFLEDNTIEIKI